MARQRTTVEFDVYVECAECGNDLTADFTTNTITIEPCDQCMTRAHKEGLEEAEAES